MPSEPAAATPLYTAQELQDPHAVHFMFSFDVMTEELERVGQELETLNARGDGDVMALNSLTTRKMALEVRMSQLEQMVAGGQLSMEQYLQRIKERIAAETQLYRRLKQMGKQLDSKKVADRVKKMQNEVNTAEAASASGGGPDE